MKSVLKSPQNAKIRHRQKHFQTETPPTDEPPSRFAPFPPAPPLSRPPVRPNGWFRDLPPKANSYQARKFQGLDYKLTGVEPAKPVKAIML